MGEAGGVGGPDAVQEGLDNPPPGGWMPRGVGGRKYGGTGEVDGAANLDSSAGNAQEREKGGHEGRGGGENGEEARSVVVSLLAKGMQVLFDVCIV